MESKIQTSKNKNISEHYLSQEHFEDFLEIQCSYNIKKTILYQYF